MIDAARAMARIRAQHELGPRYCGSPGHARAQALLAEWLAGADRLREHTFVERFFGREVVCKNLWARFEGEREGRLMLGTHYDTRPWADRDLREPRAPVPGANDGGSGVALFAELARELPTRRGRPSVDVVLFDAEDWHEIDGKEVSLGARRFVADLAPAEAPDAMVDLDMVGGHDLMLDLDLSGEDELESYALALSLHRLGSSLGLRAFALDKEAPYKLIGCDHTPFVEAGIPAAILIDIDYPEWHTTRDVPAACSEASLAEMARFLEALVYESRGSA